MGGSGLGLAIVDAIAKGHGGICTVTETPGGGATFTVRIPLSAAEVPAPVRAGDVVLHMGYAPVNVRTIESILKRGIRLIHTSPYGRPATLIRRSVPFGCVMRSSRHFASVALTSEPVARRPAG